MNFMIVPVILVCSNFLISMSMFIVSNPLVILSATVIVRSGGAFWLNPFAAVLFNLYIACRHYSVLCCVPVLRGCV